MNIRTYLYLFTVLTLILSCDNRKLPTPVFIPNFHFSPENGVTEAGKEFSFNLKIIKDSTEGHPDNIKHGLSIQIKPLLTDDEKKADPYWFRKYDSLNVVINDGPTSTIPYSLQNVPLKEDNQIKLTNKVKGNYLLILKVMNDSPYFGTKLDTLFLTVE